MEKGISFYFGFALSPEERASMIKDAGFDRVMTSADERLDNQNGTLKEQIKLFEKYNLKPTSLYMSYTTPKLPLFWKEGEEGEEQKNRLIKEINLAHEFGFTCLVVHCEGNYSKIGEKRLLTVLDECERLSLPLAIENLDNKELFVSIFDKIQHPKLQFCFDSGHNNIFNKDFDYLSLYKDKLITLHLHDNDGTWDQHTLNSLGNINWQKIGEKLRGKDIILDYELLLNKKDTLLSPFEHLLACKKQADELEKIILKN